MIELPLSKGAVTVIDDADFASIGSFKWSLHSRGYAVRTVRTATRVRMVSMHRELLACPEGLVVDHINLNTLDNRRTNLRVCTAQENMRNRRSERGSRSRYKGVARNSALNKWVAGIGIDGRRFHLGTFTSEIDAALAYDNAARDCFGEFAHLNFPMLKDV
jgi:hypothetical protein